MAHCIAQWTTYAQSAPQLMTDPQVLALYEVVGGYDPTNPASDQGAVEMDVLNYWLNTGTGADKLSAFAGLNIASKSEIQDAINWFGNAYIGINCPQSAIDNTKVWDLVPGSPIAGGHAVILVGYDEKYFYTVSWGMLIPTTWNFLATYLEEAYALVNMDFVTSAGTTPAGLNLSQLVADLAMIKASP